MRGISRRRLLRSSAGIGVAGLLGKSTAASEHGGDGGHGDHGGHGSSGAHSSPDLEKYVQSLPIPEERTPDDRRRGAPYHEIPVRQAEHSFHPDLPDTTIWGFDGQFPGPVLVGQRNEQFRVEFDNSHLPEDHLFEVDEGIGGTTTENYVGYDGPVPEVRTVTHFHGLNVPPESDGQAEMWTSPGGVEGPRFERAVQELPNRQQRLTSTYHDHARGISRLNNYAGLVGPYYIREPGEGSLDLPEGEYDVPLVLADRSFHDDGSLYYPDEFVPNFAGDVATVNGAAWPYVEVEPRRYRFRILNPSNGRTYGLRLESGDGHHDGGDGHGDAGGHDASGDAGAPTIYQLSAGHGFLEDVVSIGSGGDQERLLLAPFERAEVVVDFSEYAGETFTLANDAAFPFSGGGHDGGMDHGSGMEDDGGMDGNGGMNGDSGMGGDGGMGHGSGDHPQIHELAQFRVAERGGRPDRTTHPTDLRLPRRRGPDPADAQTTREMSLEMVMGSNPSLHTINGKRWGDDIQHRPELGTTEVWELHNTSTHTHPVHLHLVNFEVIGRGPDGTEPPLPNERGGKDVVRVDPEETVRIAVEFGDYTGRYPFHCHVLEHEEHDMMRPFEVVAGDDGPGRGRGRGHGRGEQQRPGASGRRRWQRLGSGGRSCRRSRRRGHGGWGDLR